MYISKLEKKIQQKFFCRESLDRNLLRKILSIRQTRKEARKEAVKTLLGKYSKSAVSQYALTSNMVKALKDI